MPEWDDKKKVWRDWVGAPISDAQRAQQKRTESYLYDLMNLSQGMAGALDRMSPDEAGKIMGGLKKNLQEQYYGKSGLPADYIGKETHLGVAGIGAQAQRDVADITGRYGVEAGKENMANILPLLSSFGGEGGGSGVPVLPSGGTTLGAGPAADEATGLTPDEMARREREKKLQERLKVLDPFFPGGEAGGFYTGGGRKKKKRDYLFREPTYEDWFR